MLANVKSPLSRKAVLVAVNISQWTARKLDRKVTKETNAKYHAKEDAGRYNKLLIEKERIAKITALVSAARALHYKYTKPWLDDGPRILPNAVYMEFCEAFREIKREFEVEVDKFCREYPAYIEERKAALNGLFDPADYPDPSEIRSKFNLDHKFSALADVEDFRSDLDPEIAEDIKREIAAQANSVTDVARKDTLEQVLKVVGHMVNRLKERDKDDGARLYDSVVDNIRELAKLLPAFNFDNDPKMNKLADRLTKELCTEDVKTLRDNDDVRKDVTKSAEDIFNEVKEMFG